MFDIAITACIVALALYGYVIYGIETRRKKLRPRVATWLIWAILGTCVSFLQVKHGAGLGAVVTIIAACANYVLAGMAWRYGHKNIHPVDIASAVLALGVIILWAVATDDVTTIFATLTYLFGFLPTFERAYRKPYDENITPFVMSALKYTLSLMVIAHYSLETVLYPIILAALNALFVAMVLLRRHSTKKHKKTTCKKSRHGL